MSVDSGRSIQDPGPSVLAQDLSDRIQDCGLQIVDPESWIQNPRTQDPGSRVLDLNLDCLLRILIRLFTLRGERYGGK